MDRFPLLDRPDDAALFLTPAGPVSAGRFLREAHALAAALPPGRHVLNLCRDRYRFALTVAAALLADRVSLLCGDPSPAVAAALCRRYPDTAPVGDDHPSAACRPAPSNPALPADRLAAIVFTSGSTGAPVAHEKRWGALVSRSRAAGERFELSEHAPATVIGTVPPGHMYGFETTVLLPLHAACASWCGPAFFPGDVSAALRAAPAPILVTTPLQLRSLQAIAAPFPRRCISATAPLDPALAARVEAAWSAPLVEIFGATECGSVATRRPTQTEYWQPYPGVVLDGTGPDAVVRAPFASAVPLADEVALRRDGSFSLLGRRADVVKLGGRRASLAGLNRILTGLDGVQDGVFVVPDDLESRSTARLVALVVAPGRSGADLLAELRDRIDPLFLPRRLVRVDALPRNTLGKLPRQAVLDLLAGAAPAACPTP